MPEKISIHAVERQLLAVGSLIGLSESITVLEQVRETVAEALSRFGVPTSRTPKKAPKPARRRLGFVENRNRQARDHYQRRQAEREAAAMAHQVVRHPVARIAKEPDSFHIPNEAIGTLTHVGGHSLYDTLTSMMAKGPVKIAKITHALKVKGFVKDETPETKREVTSVLLANKTFAHVTRGVFGIRKRAAA